MKKLKIFLMLNLLLCFGFTLSSEVHAQGDGPKPFEIGDILPVGQIMISWDFSELTITEDDFIRIEGTNDFAIYMAVYRDMVNFEISIMGDYFDIIKGKTTITLDSITEITGFTSDGNNYFGHIQDALFWEFIGDYQEGYMAAREDYGYYDPITEQWLSVEEYLDLYGNGSTGSSDFYVNFDKYFIPAMIIVFGGAIVLTILKVFKGRE